MSSDAFETSVLSQFFSERSRFASPALVSPLPAHLSFKTLRNKQPNSKVAQSLIIPKRPVYKVSWNNPRFLAEDIFNMIEGDNPDQQLEFFPDLHQYVPDPDLVKESKVPLWILKPTAGNTVMINRVW